MKNILCLSTSNYYPFPTRKQNVMNRMGGCRVVYVDPAVTYIAPLKDKNAKERLKKYKEAPISPLPHIKVYAQPPVMPFYNKKRSFNQHNQKKLAGYLAKLVKDNDFGTDFCLWCYSPTSADVVEPLAKELGIAAKKLWANTVYDCVDRHSAYPGMIDPEVVDKMEEDLASRCGCVFTTAQGLFDRLSKFNANTHLIPNGAAYELFSKTALLRTGRSKDLNAPNFCFVGMLQECIDYGLMKAVSRAYPNGSLSCIGRTLPGVDLSWASEYPNIKFLGLKPQDELPELLAGMDVCLNIFKDNDLSKDVSPLKFYEYLATGIPVVSTPVPLQVSEYKDCVYIGSGEEDFLAECQAALEEPEDSPLKLERMQIARSCSWDERVNMMRKILEW